MKGSNWIVRTTVFLLISSTVLLVSSCSSVKPKEPTKESNVTVPSTPIQTQSSQDNTDSTKDQTSQSEEPPAKTYAYSYPLTGLGTDKEIKTRPVMVMVENSHAARPQTGLAQADIVYEILAEAEVTRFAAIFQSQSPKVIGPIRSIRPYYVHIGEGLDAVIVHAGWSQAAENLLVFHHLNHLDEVYGDGQYYWRGTERKPPHNLYSSIDKIELGAKNKHFHTTWRNPNIPFLSKNDSIAGKDVQNVKIHYLLGYYVSYQYDPEKQVYQRSMNGEPHLDKISGKQITAANVMIVRAKHHTIAHDKKLHRTVDITGSGKGYLIQKGKMKEITWQYKNGMIRPYIDGKEQKLVPGTTWIQVVKEDAKVEFK